MEIKEYMEWSKNEKRMLEDETVLKKNNKRRNGKKRNSIA